MGKRRKPIEPKPTDEPGPLAHLGKVVAARIKALGARVDPALAGDERKLRTILSKARRRSHAELRKFDAFYGGLVLPDSDWHWLLGAHACLLAGEAIHSGPPVLIPIAVGKDAVAYMRHDGAVCVQNCVLDAEPRPFAQSGAAFIARIVLFDLRWALQEQHEGASVEGKHGARIAKAMGVTRIRVASGGDWRFWGDDERLVVEGVEDGRVVTRVAGPRARRFAKRA